MELVLLQEVRDHADDEETRDAIAELEKEITDVETSAKAKGRELKSLPKMKPMSNEVGLGEGCFFFRHASHSVHTSRISLGYRMSDVGDGKVTLNFGGTPQVALQAGLFTGELFLSTYLAMAYILDWESTPDIEEFKKTLDNRFLELRRTAGITTDSFGH